MGASSTYPFKGVSTDVPAKRRRRPVSYLRSGLYAAPTLPGLDTEVGRILAERKASLVADVGGDPSTAQLALVDLIVATWAKLDSIQAYLIGMPSLIDRRHRRVWLVVRDCETLAARLQSLLRDLGLERRARDVRLDVVSALAEAASRPTRGVEKSPADDAPTIGGRLPPINGSEAPHGTEGR